MMIYMRREMPNADISVSLEWRAMGWPMRSVKASPSSDTYWRFVDFRPRLDVGSDAPSRLRGK